MAEFHQTKMGRQFYDSTMPRLARAVERLAGSVEGKRDPVIQELIDHVGYLVDSVEQALDSPIAPGSERTRDAFDSLRSQTVAIRRILTKVGGIKNPTDR